LHRKVWTGSVDGDLQVSKSVKGTYLRKRLAKTAVTLLVMSSMMALSTYAPGGTAFAASGAWKDITDGGSFNGPGGIAVDSAGDVFVTNGGSNTIEELPSGSSTWKDITYGGSFNYPAGIAVDSNGDVFVVNSGVSGTSNAVLELPSGSSAWKDITDGVSFNYPAGIAVDSKGEVFVTNSGVSGTSNAVLELSSGSGTWKDITHGNSFSTPTGIAVDNAGDVFVTNQGGFPGGTIDELKSGANNWKNITNGVSFIGPDGVAVDSAGSVYVVDRFTNKIEELPSGSSNWKDITNGGSLNSPSGIALDNLGDMFVTNYYNSTSDAVEEYALPPVTPTGILASDTTSTGTTLSWGAVAGATSYNVYENGGSTPIATGVTGTSYTVGNLFPGKSYKYTVSAVNASGESLQSSAVTVNTASIGAVALTFGSTNVQSGAAQSVTGVVYDVYNTAVSNAIVDLTSTIGTWGETSVTADGNGVFSTIWTAPTVSTTTSGTVTATVYGTVYGAVSNAWPTTLTITVNAPATSGGSSGRSSHSNTSGSGNTTGSSPLWITSPTVIPTGQPNQSFSRALTASGGTEPYTWNILAGTLPPGITLDEITGVISGTTGSSKPEIVTVEVRDTSGETQTKQVVVDALPQGARELVWQATDLHAEYVPVVVRSDAGTPTTYMPIWYVMQILKGYGVSSAWDGHNWRLGKDGLVPFENVQPGVGTMHMYLNGKLVQNVTGLYAKDPNSGKPTTYMPIWYVMQLLDKLSVGNTWNGTTWSIGLQSSTPNG